MATPHVHGKVNSELPQNQHCLCKCNNGSSVEA